MRRSWSPLIGLMVATGCFSDPPSGTSSGAGSSTGPETTSSTTDAPGSTTTEQGSSGSSGTPDPTATSSTDPGTTETEGTTTGPGDSSTTEVPPDTGPIPCPLDGRPVLFVNFDGVVLEDSGAGVDSAPFNIVGNAQLAGEHAAYEGEDRDMVFNLIRGHFEPTGLCVVDEAPDAADYDMIVVTSDTFNDDPNILGLPNLDCGNEQLNNVNVVFLSAMVNIGPPQRAIAISKFAGAMYGLEDVTGNGDIMNQFVSQTSNGATFTMECLPLVAAPQCDPDETCASGQQTSLGRLSDAF